MRIGDCSSDVCSSGRFEELETLALGPQAIGVGAVEGVGHRLIKVSPGNRATGFQAGGDEGGCTDFGSDRRVEWMGHDGGLRTDCPVGSLSPDPPSLSCFRLVCPSGGFACVEARTWSAYCGPYIPDISDNLDNVGTTAYMDREGVIAMVAQVDRKSTRLNSSH